MSRRTVHNATVTLKLPFDMDPGAEISALQAAGIPVNALGNAERGFLFVRFSDGWKNKATIFRWFASEVGQGHRDCGAALCRSERGLHFQMKHPIVGCPVSSIPKKLQYPSR